MLISLNGTPIFSGAPVSCGAARGALIQTKLPVPELLSKERS